MNEASLLARVQAHLDARCDPLDDADVMASLDAHPEWLLRIAGLRADARALAGLPVPQRSRRWPWIASACFATAAAALVTVSLRPPPRCAGRIVAASLAELRPRAHVAANFVVSESLVTTPTTRLETWQTVSEARGTKEPR